MAFFNDFFRFFLILKRFWQGFGRVWEWFFDDFSHFFPKLRFYWKVNKTLRGRMNFKGRLLKKRVKVTKKLIKNRCKFTIKKMRKKAPKNLILEGVGLNLGRVWGGIWKGLELFEQGMDRFWICLAWFGLAAAELINWTPALIREASQCAGVPLQRGWIELVHGLILVV